MAAIHMHSEISWRWTLKEVVRAERSLEVLNRVVLGMMARDGARDGLGVSGLGSRRVAAYSKPMEMEVKFRKEIPGGV